jgi:hypothetical protein
MHSQMTGGAADAINSFIGRCRSSVGNSFLVSDIVVDVENSGEGDMNDPHAGSVRIRMGC